MVVTTATRHGSSDLPRLSVVREFETNGGLI
jgi:hypothetical protein